MKSLIPYPLANQVPSSGKLKSISIIGFISIVTGFLVLMGWVFNIAVIKTILPQFVSMKFNTAVEFILLGSALLLTQMQSKKGYQIISLILYALIIGISIVSLLQTIFHFNTGIDQIFITDTKPVNQHFPYPGRMSTITATCFALFGLALLGLALKSTLTHKISQYLLNLITAISAIALIGYLYGLSAFYNISYAGSMAIHTAFLLFCASLTASWLQPAFGVNKLFAGQHVGNIMARRLLIIAICITVFFGILSVIGKHYQLFSFNDGLSILIICLICAGFVMLWSMAKWLNRLDKGRRDAEQEVMLANEQLELKVKQRSEKLTNLFAKYRETEAKFKAAFEHSAIGTALVTLKGKWFQVNRSLCDIMGYNEQELISMSFESINGDNRMIETHSENELTLSVVNNSQRIERRYKCKDNSIVWISVNTAAVTNKRGGAIYFVSQFENITKRKKAELSLKAAYKDIEQHVKTIQGIAWKQSHMIRRPLANLQGLTVLLKDDNGDNEVLRHMEKELNALDQIIIEMAEDAACKGITKIVAKKRSFKKPVHI